MKRGEIKNIISKDWDKRQEKYKKRSAQNSERVKEWKLKEKPGLNKSSGIPRSSSNKASPTITLSLLVAVTYAKDS